MDHLEEAAYEVYTEPTPADAIESPDEAATTVTMDVNKKDLQCQSVTRSPQVFLSRAVSLATSSARSARARLDLLETGHVQFVVLR